MEQRIAYVMSRFPKVTETFILREMEELQALGWDVSVFALVRERVSVTHPGVAPFLARAQFASPGALGSVVASNVRASSTHPVRYFGVLLRTARHSWRSPSFLVRSLAAFPFAVHWGAIAQKRGIAQIHAHFATHAAYAAYVMSQVTGIPFSFTAHAHDIYTNRTMLGEKIHRSAAVVTISDYNHRVLARLFPDLIAKVHVIHCGINTGQFTVSRSMRPGSSSDTLSIVCVGRLQESKGMRYLVEACRELKARGLRFTCAIVGDGPDRPTLREYLTRNDLLGEVKLTGWLPSEEVYALLASADIFALPSVVAHDGQMEGIPNVLMEAMSCQLPVVSTTISGIPELVTSGEHGLLVPPGDALALADALAYLAANPTLRSAMGQAGRARVMAEFDLRKNVAAKAKLFSSLI